MKPFFAALIMMSLLVLSPAARAEGPDDQYLSIYSVIQQGDTLREKGQWMPALVKYTEAQSALKQFEIDNPQWSAKLIKYRMSYLAGKVAELSAKAASGEAVGPVELKLKWQMGKRYLQRIEQTQIADVAVPNMAQNARQEIKQAFDIAFYPVKERDGGGRELQMEIIGEKIETTMGGRTFLSFDSNQERQKDAGNPAAPMFRKLVGVRITYLTDVNGKVEKVEGLDEVMDRATEGGPEEVKAQVKGMFKEASLKELCSQAQGLPDKAVKVGDTWPIKTEENIEPMGIVVQNLTYTLKSWEQHDNHKCALLEYTGGMTLKSSDGSQAAQVSIENAQVSGKTWFDPALGMVIEETANTSMTIKIEVQGQSVSTKVSAVVNSKLAKVEAASK